MRTLGARDKVALAVLWVFFLSFLAAGYGVTAVNRSNQKANDWAIEALATTNWTPPLERWTSDGCVWSTTRICLKDRASEPVTVAADRAAQLLRLTNATSSEQPGFDGQPVAYVQGKIEGVDVTISAFPRTEYPSKGKAVQVTWMTVELTPRHVTASD